MVNDGEVRVYERRICQNLHFDHRWYIFPILIGEGDSSESNAQRCDVDSVSSSTNADTSGGNVTATPVKSSSQLLDLRK